MSARDLPEIIKQTLLQFYWRSWATRSLRMLCILLSVCLLYMLLICTGDAYLHWTDAFRYLCATVFWLFVSYLNIRHILLPLLRRPSLQHIAQQYEKQYDDQLHNHISSAVSFCDTSHPGVSPWMMQRCIASATQTIQDHAQEFKKPQVPQRRLLFFICLFWLFLIIPTSPRAYLLRSSLPWLNIPRPTAVNFEVNPGNIKVSSGTDVIVEARTFPAVESLECAISWNDGHQEILVCELIDKHTQKWQLDLGPTLESFSYTLRSHNAESPRYQVDVGAAAQISDTHIQVTPPHYITKNIRHISSGDTDVLKGSELQFYARMRHFDLHRATLIGENDWRLPLTVEDDGDGFIVTAAWQADVTQHYSLHLWNQQGLHHQHPQQWFIRVIDDEPPQLTCSIPLTSYAISGDKETLLLRINAEDDFAVESMGFTLGNQHGTLDQQKLAIKQSQKKIISEFPIDLSRWNHSIGDRLWIEVECTDIAGQSQRSKRLAWQIGTQDHLLLAQHSHQLKHIVSLLTTLQNRASLLTSRWSNIRSNFRIDDINAQSGDLLQADQQMLGIQKSFTDIINAVTTIKENVALQHRPSLEWLDSLCLYGYHHHCLQFTNRGAQLLQMPIAELASILENSVTDSELLAAHISRLLLLTQTIDAALSIDTLEHSSQLNQSHIEDTLTQIRGEQWWSTPIYTNKLRCDIYGNRSLKDKALITDHRGIFVKDLNVPNHGNLEFSINWRGQLLIPQDGQWTFTTNSDDGVQIRIDDQDLLTKDAWKEQAATAFSNTLTLTQGWHNIDIRYFQSTGNSSFSMTLGLKGSSPKNINDFKMRSPIINQKTDLIRFEMLSHQSLDTISWSYCQESTQKILDCALQMHEWAINLAQPRLHRSAQSFTKACTPYREIIDSSVDDLESPKIIKWKTVVLKNYFNDARLVIAEQLKQWQVPVTRIMPLDDLILHIYQMEQVSKSLKDWGLPYERIAQTYRFLNRSKDQALTLYHRCNASLSQTASNSQLSTGERSTAWMINNQLRTQIFEKVSGIEIDNHNVLWQLPALQKSLMDIYLRTKIWRNYYTSTHPSALDLSSAWIENQKNQLASWYAYRAYTQSLEKSTPGHTALADLIKQQAQWGTFNNTDPGQATHVLDQFIQTMDIGAREVDGHDLKHIWQIALIDAERAFALRQTARAQASLYIAITLQDKLEQDAIKKATLKDILQSSKYILASKRNALEELQEKLVTSDDSALQETVQLQQASDIIEEAPSVLLVRLRKYEEQQRFSINLQTYDSWVQLLSSHQKQKTVTIQGILQRYQLQQQNAYTQSMKFFQSLNENAQRETTQQTLRWKSLAKDIEKNLRPPSKEEGEKPLFFINHFFKQHAQLYLFSLEQADYTRRRFSAFELEDPTAQSLLRELITLQQDHQRKNHAFLTDLYRLAKGYSSKLNSAMRYHWQHNTIPNEDAPSAQKLWTATQSLINKSNSALSEMRETAADLRVHYNIGLIKKWQSHVSKSTKLLSDYWAQSLNRQLILDQLQAQNKTALLALYAEIDVIHLHILLHIHEHYNHLRPEAKLWDKHISITNNLIADMTIRLQSLGREMSVLTYQDIEIHDPINDILEFWQHAAYQQEAAHLIRDLSQLEPDGSNETIKRVAENAAAFVDLSFAHACRLLHQRGQHVQTHINISDTQQFQQQQTPLENYQRLFEQQWQHGKMLIQMHSQYEDYDVFNTNQQLLIYDYFNMINKSSP